MYLPFIIIDLIVVIINISILKEFQRIGEKKVESITQNVNCFLKRLYNTSAKTAIKTIFRHVQGFVVRYVNFQTQFNNRALKL